MNDKKIFSIKLFINNFLQLKVMGILGTVLITLFSVLSIVSQGIRMIEYTKEGISVNGSMSGGVSTTYLGAGELWPLVLTFVFVTPVLMLMAFSYNNKRNSSDFYNSLPYTRLNMYLTKLSAVFAWLSKQTASASPVYSATDSAGFSLSFRDCFSTEQDEQPSDTSIPARL